MQARYVLAFLAIMQIIAVGMNWYSPIMWFMFPVAVLALVAMVLAIYYKWKRGVELFIFLCIILFVMALVPFCAIIVAGRQGEKWLDVTWYVVGMLVNALAVLVAWWILYSTDYSTSEKEERKSLLSRVSPSFRNSQSSQKDYA